MKEDPVFAPPRLRGPPDCTHGLFLFRVRETVSANTGYGPVLLSHTACICPHRAFSTNKLSSPPRVACSLQGQE